MKIRSTFFYLVVICFFVFVTGFCVPAQASHIVGGEITYHSDTTNTSSLLYHFKLVIYTDNHSTADQEVTSLNFGDNTSADAARVSKTPLTANLPISRSVYYFEHSYVSPGTYLVSLKEFNRGAAFQNIPNSVGVPFVIQATVQIGIGSTPNHSPVFMAPLIAIAPINEIYRHNLTAFDADGDSLAYKLIPCLKEVDTPISDYQFPEIITIDSRRGEINWNRP